MRTAFVIVPKAENVARLTLGERFLQDVMFGLKFGNEITALEVLAKFLRSDNAKKPQNSQLITRPAKGRLCEGQLLRSKSRRLHH